MIKVRHLKSNTRHAKYGRLYRGLFDNIDPKDFNSELFERIPASPDDFGTPSTEKGKPITKKRREEIQVQRFNAWKKKHQKQYDDENKLALQRKEGGK